MSDSLLWIGGPEPPDAVTGLATRRGWTVRTVDPAEGADAVTRHRPAVVVVGAVDADVARVRTAAPAPPIAYCPPTTTADGVSDAVAAGADVVLPQDADVWGTETLAQRLADTPPAGEQSTAVSVSDGAGAVDPSQQAEAGEPPAVPAAGETEHAGERPPPRGLLAVDATGTISYVGSRAADLLDREATALLHQDLREALPWLDVPPLTGDAAEAASTTERLMPANRWLKLTVHPIAAGATVSIRELGEEERRRVVLDRLHGVTTRLFDAATPEAVADIASEATHDVLGLDVVAVRLYDPTADVLRLAAATDAVGDLMPARPTYAVGEGVVGRAFETGSPQISPELDVERFGEVRSAICLPLGDHGTISVGSTAPEAFDEADISLARLLSSTVTAALDRADREARVRRREAVLESIQGMVFAIDENGVLDYVSAPLAERLGEDRDEIVGEHVIEFVDVSEFSHAESLIEDGEEEVSVDVRIHPTEGDPFPAAVDLSLLEQPGEGDVLVGVVEDRSTLAATREDLRREHERLWTLFENLPDPVVDAEHVEDGPVIRAANDAFAEVFDCDRDEIAGKSIDEVLASPAGEAAGSMPPEAINEQVREGEVTGAKVRRETTHGARTFLFRGIPYAENGGVRAFGIYTDVTEIERRERHVKVLDRLLRHNLRNDLGVVIGRAENVLDRSDDPAVRAEATELVEAASELIDLSDTAKRIRRIIEEPAAARSAMRVPALFEDVVADARDRFPAATVRAETADADLAVLATSDLRLALEELVENGVVHGGDSPTVELRAEPFEPAPAEWVDLLVVDDGPGIPETERAAVTGDRDITQLEHGSGLGLWLVRWAVESVGGDLAFERRDGRTAVRLRLRRADAE